jgi:dTDP-4-dehydrorhamnose reductase
LESNKDITGFNDVFFNPVSIGFLIDVLQFLIDIDFKGIINLGCEIPTSKYDFIREIASKLDIEPRVISASRSTNPLQSIRYPDLALDISLLKSMFHKKIPVLTEMMDNEVEYRKLNPRPKESNAFSGQ